MIFSFFIDERLGGKPRSSAWNGCQKRFLELHPLCEVCGARDTLLNPIVAHHILPFHRFPEFELTPSNIITLCRKHHLEWGHLGYFGSWNEAIREDATRWRLKVKNRP